MKQILSSATIRDGAISGKKLDQLSKAQLDSRFRGNERSVLQRLTRLRGCASGPALIRRLEIRAPFRPELRLHLLRAVDLARLAHAFEQLARRGTGGLRSRGTRRRRHRTTRPGCCRGALRWRRRGTFGRCRRGRRWLVRRKEAAGRCTSGKAEDEHRDEQSCHVRLPAFGAARSLPDPHAGRQPLPSNLNETFTLAR